MHMRLILLAFIVILSARHETALAFEVDGLYETEVVAASQSPQDQDAAIKQALAVVLKRTLAGEDFLQDAAVRAALANAKTYVKQYQYALQETPAGNARSARNLRVLFNEQALLELMKARQLKVWPDHRPETLLWLVVDEEDQRVFFKPEAMPQIHWAIQQASKQLGLPLLMPLLDLDEQRMISVNDVLSAYPQHLLSVSGRYDVVSILAGRLAKTDEGWKTDWAFYFDDNVEQWSSPSSTLNETVVTGLQGVYQRLSRYYGVAPSTFAADTLTLKIAGVKDNADQARIMSYLKNLQAVKSVLWQGQDNGLEIYKLTLDGSRQAFEQTVGLGRVLNPRTMANGLASELRYELIPVNPLRAQLN